MWNSSLIDWSSDVCSSDLISNLKYLLLSIYIFLPDLALKNERKHDPTTALSCRIPSRTFASGGVGAWDRSTVRIAFLVLESTTACYLLLINSNFPFLKNKTKMKPNRRRTKRR